MGISVFLAGALCFCLLYGRAPTAPLAAASVGLCAACFFYSRAHRHHHGAFLSLDIQAQKSRLMGCHPALKACFAVGVALICIAADQIPLSLFVAASMLALTVGLGGTSLHYYLSLLGVPVVFILLGTVAILFEISSLPLGLLDIPVGRWFLSVTPVSQMRALSVMTRAFGAVSCLYFLSLSTPMAQLIGVLRRARLPAVVAELMYLIYRYIFVLLETQSHMRTAAGSRLGYRTLRLSLKTMLSSSMNLLFLSFRRSSDCFAAMESRCYDGQIAFWERTAVLKKIEVAAAVGYAGLLIALAIGLGGIS